MIKKIGGKWVVLFSNPPLSYSELKPTDLLTTRELMVLLGISRRQIYRWIHNGNLIPYKEVGKEYLFRKKDVEAFRKVKRSPGRPKKELNRHQEAFII